MGKVKNYLPDTDQLLLKHWIPAHSTSSTSFTLTSTKIRPCPGCHLADDEDPDISHSAYLNNCYITLPAYSAIEVDINRYNSTLTTRSLSFSFFISISISNFHHFVSLDNSLYRLPRTFTRPLYNNPIEKYFRHGSSFDTLSTYRTMFSQSSILQFYTDGSYRTNSHYDVTMGFAWIQTSSSSPRLAFQAFTSKWPSAYKSELMAVLAAIVVCPADCEVDIFTDCQSIVNTSQEIANFRYANRRNILKDSHSYLWCIIYETIILLKLTVNFHKVLAHSNNSDNNQVHILASQAHQFSSIIFSEVPTIHLPFLPTWQGHLINVHHRHFIRSISKLKGHLSWTIHTFNERYVDLNVDWSSSFDYFNQDEPSYVTSMKASYKKSCKIKNLLESLPVMAKLQALRPHVYDNSWSRCIKCKQQTESFQHIWICPITLDILYQIIQSAKQQLLDWTLQLKRPEIQDLSPLITSAVWSVPLNGHNSHHFSFLDLIKGVVPQQFKNLLLSIVISPLAADRILSFIMNFIFHATREFIWKPRCNLVNNEERCKGITRKQKRSPTASNSYMSRTPQGLDAFNKLSTSKWDFEVHAFINFNYNPLGFSLSRSLLSFICSLEWILEDWLIICAVLD